LRGSIFSKRQTVRLYHQSQSSHEFQYCTRKIWWKYYRNSQLSPCGHPAITERRYIPGRNYKENVWKQLALLRTPATTELRTLHVLPNL